MTQLHLIMSSVKSQGQ